MKSISSATATIPLEVLALVLAAAIACSWPATRAGAAAHGQAWPVVGGQAANDHYSDLSQINRRNVKKLAVAWKFDTGEAGDLQANPVIVGRVLYAYTPSQKVIALDAATGKLLWKFDTGIKGRQPARGVAYWTDGKESRVFAGVMDFLYALDASTGRLIGSFGEDGRIDLRKGLRGDYRLQSIVLTSPGTIYKDLIIVGGRNPETPPAPPGDIRAFDVHTGALRWRFHTIPHPGELGYDTWPKDAWKTAGAANNWGGMTLDEKRGIVYVPTGSAVPDFYGAGRLGNDLFADSLLALDAETGKLLWYFQGVHHDLWDRDFPSAPSLVTLKRDGKSTDAVAQTTKQGWLFLLDRTDGHPLFPIEERKTPASTVPGEVASPTQPYPLAPAPYNRERLTEDMLTNRTPEAHAWAVRQFRAFVNDGPFTPLSLDRQTVVFPGFDGGAEWGGAAVDPSTNVLYVNANDIAATGSLIKGNPLAGLGSKTYQNQCAVCHRENRAGSPPEFPSLVDVYQKLTSEEISEVIHQGRGRMPSFPAIRDGELKALLNYLRTGKDMSSAAASSGGMGELLPVEPNATPENAKPSTPSDVEMAYTFTGYKKFYDPDGYPAVAPPWGTLSAVNLNTGKYLWKIPLGNYPELAAKGMTDTGTENYGGPVVTAGGLVFIGASIFDKKFRAFNSSTGKLLWEADLPFSGCATPSTYMIDGKQYVVIAASGGRERKFRDHNAPSGGIYIAFTLQ